MSETKPDFRALFESAPGCFLVLDPDLTIVAVSDAYLTATMTRREGILWRDVFEVFPENPEELATTGEKNLRASLDRVRRERVPDSMAVQKWDLQRSAAEGGGFEVRYWSVRNSPVVDDDGNLTYIINRVEDVTEFVRLTQEGSDQQQHAAELEERTSQMESEILARSSELQEANVRLRAADAAKNLFLSRMSHELRTPLNAILGFAQLLEVDDLSPDQRESVDQILSGGRHLLALINEVLDLSRVESGNLALSLEAVGAAEVFAETRSLIGSLAAERGIVINSPPPEDCPYHVRADRQRLMQVLLNLAANAVKYNRPGGTIGFSCERTDTGSIRIGVTDTGPGIPEEHFERLFAPFDRLGAEYSDVEGAGMGLALSKRLMELMGGTLAVESTVGEGTTFSVELVSLDAPVDEHADVDELPLRALNASSSKCTVLYVEDNPSNLRLMERVLARRPNTSLITTSHGDAAPRLAREHRPDLVLLDMNLPGCDGEEVLSRLKAQPETAAVPVVIVSADAAPAQIERMLAAGARDYLTKPIDVTALLGVLDRSLAPDGEPVSPN
jgi:signal transduction histidine kinase/ActR/RegA family two-component response regulator